MTPSSDIGTFLVCMSAGSHPRWLVRMSAVRLPPIGRSKDGRPRCVHGIYNDSAMGVV
jgi:hypothetical protein